MGLGSKSVVRSLFLTPCSIEGNVGRAEHIRAFDSRQRASRNYS